MYFRLAGTRMVSTLLLVSLRETICFHLRRALHCCTQHFFFFFFLLWKQELSQRTQPTNTGIQSRASSKRRELYGNTALLEPSEGFPHQFLRSKIAGPMIRNLKPSTKTGFTVFVTKKERRRGATSAVSLKTSCFTVSPSRFVKSPEKKQQTKTTTQRHAFLSLFQRCLG